METFKKSGIGPDYLIFRYTSEAKAIEAWNRISFLRTITFKDSTGSDYTMSTSGELGPTQDGTDIYWNQSEGWDMTPDWTWETADTYLPISTPANNYGFTAAGSDWTLPVVGITPTYKINIGGVYSTFISGESVGTRVDATLTKPKLLGEETVSVKLDVGYIGDGIVDIVIH